MTVLGGDGGRKPRNSREGAVVASVRLWDMLVSVWTPLWATRGVMWSPDRG